MTQLRARLATLGQGLAQDTAWSLGLEAARVVGTLVSFTLLGRSLGAEGYGNYAALYAIVGPIGSLSASGVGLALLEHIIREDDDTETTFRSCLSMSLVLGSLLAIASTIFATFIVDLRILTILAVLVLEMVMVPVFATATNLVRARDGFGAAARYLVGTQLVKVSILVVLFVMDELTIGAFATTNLAIMAVLALTLVLNVGRRYEISSAPGAIQRRHLRSSFVYSAGITGLSLQTDGDKLLLASYGQTAATGIYAAAYRVVQLGLLPITAIIGATHHRFLEHDGNQKGQHLGRALVLSRVAVVYGIVVGLVLLLIAPLLPVLVGSEFDESVEVVRWLSPLVLIRGLAIFPLNGLMGLNQTTLRTVLLLVSSAISIGIYVWLIPEHSWRGAAIGTAVGEVFLAIAAWGFLVSYQRHHDRVLGAAHDGESRP
jgi:O-antigen/teichoic acid export membrane protein